MNILIIQENGRHEENRSFRECFCLQRAFLHHGVSADVWGLGHDNYENIPSWNDYDLIINLENYDTTGWVPDLSMVKSRKFLWSIDGHVKGMGSYIRTAIRGNYDLILQATKEYVERSPDSIWFPNCYDDEVIFPLDDEQRDLYDFGFCGNINNRGPLIKLMIDKFNLKLDEFVIGPSMVRAINSYKVHWNANINIDINYRNFETMGCKTALLTSNNIHYAELGFIDGVNCLVYDSWGSMLNKAAGILKDEDRRKSIANRGYKLVKKYHTYKVRAEHILNLTLDNKKNTMSRGIM